MFLQVASEFSGVPGRVHPAHVPVRADQVDGVWQQTSRLHHGPPRENVQGQAFLVAQRANVARHFAITMHLPIERGEPGKIVVSPVAVGAAIDPRKAVSSGHLAGGTGTEAALRIPDRDLRDLAEHETADRVEPEEFRQQERGDAQAHPSSDRPTFGQEEERLVGGFHEGACKSDPFGLEGVERAGIEATPQHRREFPSEVDGVPDAGVHPLSTDGAVDVGGVSQEENGTTPKAGRDPVMNAVGGEPVHAIDPESQPFEKIFAHAFPGSRSGASPSWPGLTHQPDAPSGFQRKDGQEVGVV